jgi:Sulfotransferase family
LHALQKRIDPASNSSGAAVEERLQDMSVANGPDFMCIGMQKAGTGWVFDQLQYHPDFWMPPIKELHYLDRETPKFGNAKKKLRKARKSKKRKKEGGNPRFRRAWDERDFEFMNEAITLSGKPIDLVRYGRLFRFKGPLLSGDVTPGYSGMREEVIADVANDFPDVKILLLVRDPVTRLWSQISMANRREKFDRSLLKNPAKFREFLDEYKPFQKVGFPARIAERWEQHAPKVAFQHFFFDDIAKEPHETRRRILQYLGADPDKSSGDLKPEHNRKAAAEKLKLSDDIKAEIAGFFKDELRAAAARFGGHASTWLSLYGV